MSEKPSSINGSSTFIAIVSIVAGCLAAIIAGSFLSGAIELATIEIFPIFFPVIICAVGIFLGVVAFRISKRRLAVMGIALNAVVLLLPLGFLVVKL
ncbi:hypothetical protein [Guptibacillus hwajinpoensis]|uniref:hypothetical protein n=1 Tax=Guptibacillus hwajinpoensis TaxID=208199 RepID=UPI001CFD1EF3|nr:hypothetical protein [Pseudalkalibacillus hwajinpoensis]WLR59231.1 hypothetical protein LC071_19135 [Pseudalkalibacillus hwajinpoensis]